MNFGSQCQYQRRRHGGAGLFEGHQIGWSGPVRVVLLDRCRRPRPASRILTPCGRSVVCIRDAPDGFMLGTMSHEHDRADEAAESSPARSIAVNPPREAPTNTGCGGSRRSTSSTSPAKRGDAIIAVFGPVGLTVAAQVDRDRLPATLGHRRGRPAPRAAGLTAAVQEQPRPVRVDRQESIRRRCERRQRRRLLNGSGDVVHSAVPSVRWC